MSTMEIELNSMNTTSDGSPVVTGDENEPKSITGLDELLEQELKEGDSVDCFIKRVGDASEDSSEFGLSYDEAPVVSNSAFYSPKEETSTDNNSSLEKEFGITLNKGKEVPFTSDADKLQGGEEETRDEMPDTNTSKEGTDESTKEIDEKEEDDILNKHSIDSVQNEADESSMITEGTDSEVKDVIDKEHNVVEDTTKDKETGDKALNSVEVKLPSEIPNSDTEQTDKDTNNQNAKADNATEVHKDIFFLVFHPKDQVNKKNHAGQDNESKKIVQCSDNSTSSGSIITSNTGPDKPINKMFTIAGNSEAKNGKEINKSIIVKKITAKIIKNVNAGTAKLANECQVNDHTSGEESQSSTKSSDPEEKQHKPTDIKEEPEKAVHNDDAASVKISNPNIIITKKVYGHSKKNPKVLQEKQVSTTEDGEAPNMDKQDHSTKDEDKNLVLGNGVKLIPVKTKVLVSKEGKTLPGKPEVSGKKNEEHTKKRTKNFGAVKRKFEEICRISRQEEDAAIEEIKKMKKETLDVLKKINAEMEKLQLVFLAGK